MQTSSEHGGADGICDDPSSDRIVAETKAANTGIPREEIESAIAEAIHAVRSGSVAE